jgi:GcrA cell cycle regulator
VWTEDTIEALRKLALEGRSASAIAVALGAPSRNAVIGKANRIGIKLTGHNKCSASGVPQARVEPPWRAAIPRSKPISRKQTLAPTLPRERERKTNWIFAEAQVGEMLRIGFESIGEGDCKWPVGDPTHEDFAYCGLEVAGGRSYCAGHCRMAYRAPNARAREWEHARRPGFLRLPEPSKEAQRERYVREMDVNERF